MQKEEFQKVGNMMVKVSIVVPVYNTGDYLIKCLDSIVNQTLDNYEVIITNDGSTDHSPDIINKYAQNYPDLIKVINQENQGLSAARNNALKLAQGKYYAFVDSDDWVDLDMYEVMYNEAEENNQDIVICDMVDHFVDHEIYHQSSTFESKYTVTPSACNKMFRAEFVGDSRFPLGLWYEDFSFTTKLLFQTEKIGTIHRGMYHCHNREVSIMNNENSEKNLDMITVLDDLKDFLISKNLWNDLAYVHNYFIVDHVLITTINRITLHNNKEKNNVIRKFRDYAKSNQVNINKAKSDFNIPSKRILVAKLNYLGFNSLSKLILDIAKKIK
ncbi:glycosyltransferase [Erysipelothrix sp. HDW6A]|uniref:glycosyltransferase family 2 protein n=1 Tax=Erysipelothrix sp. HDW6A TaxID=2714928 RepID=UPI00196A6037|nr:glycosyltransferase [Erysipelothrix sp. HDW6A]